MDRLREMLIGALIGIARASEGNEFLLTPETDRLIAEGLCAKDVESMNRLLQTAKTEKRRMVPNCFSCASPCGRTADGDFVKLRERADFQLRLKILSEAERLASEGISGEPLYRALYAVGADFDDGYLSEILEGLKELTAKWQ